MRKDARMIEKHRGAFVIGLALCGLLAIAVPAVTGLSVAHAAADDGKDQGDDTGAADTGTTTTAPETAAPTTEVTVQHLTPAEVKQLEERLNTLKEQVFESRAKLKQLRDQLVLGAVAQNNVGIYHTQATSGAVRLLTLQYQLDGFDLFAEVNTDGHLNASKKIKIFDGSLLPGEHLLVVDCNYQGRGFGLFSYLDQYTFHVRSRYTFTIEEGHGFNLLVTANDQSDALESLKDRLKMKYVKEPRHD
jgi:hypothetical protein